MRKEVQGAGSIKNIVKQSSNNTVSLQNFLLYVKKGSATNVKLFHVQAST